MIEFPIIDSHVHLWDPERLDYAWMADVPVLNRSFVPEDYQQACGNVQVEQMVFVQCDAVPNQGQEEADWIATLAKDEPRLKGIVAFAPLEYGESARASLEKLVENQLVKGVRRLIQTEPDPEFCLQPDFVKGVSMLADFGLSFDLCIYHHQMGSAVKLVQQCPQVQFVLDHVGKPDIHNQRFEPWKAQIREMAAIPNVTCKISGLVCEADMENWQRADLTPYIHHVLDSFGFDRVMFGGDWPVVILAARLEKWMKTLWAEVEGCSETEKRQLFRENAIRTYRLPE